MALTSASHDKPIVGDWPTRAACAGRPELLEGDVEAAREVCMGCSVLADCTRWVLGLGFHEDPGGMVAGLTEADRKRIRDRARGRKASRTRQARRAAALERERVRDVEALAAETPNPLPISPEQAARNREQLAAALTR